MRGQTLRKVLRISLKVLLLVAALGLIIVGPWPSDNTPWQQTTYAAATLARLKTVQPLSGKGAIEAGFAQAEITPAVGQPLMGYTDRKPLDNEGTLSPCYAKAITIKSGKVAVTVLSADVLLVLENLAAEVLRRTGLTPQEIYFSASHTHSGPGGWIDNPLLEFFYGEYRQEYFDHLAAQMSRAVLESRANLQPVNLSLAQVDAPEWLENRIYSDRECLPTLSALILSARGTNRPLAIITSYAAHATVVRAETRQATADYPGYLCDNLARATGAGMVMFLAGAMGDARPRASGAEGAERMGAALAAKLLPQMNAPRKIAANSLSAVNLPVDVPAARFALGARWQYLPLFSPHLLGRTSHISLLRAGDLILCGWPADVAGEVVEPLQKWAEKERLILRITSFNGGWRGYFTTSETYFNRDNYATRMMGFMGPWAGDYFGALTKELIINSSP